MLIKKIITIVGSFYIASLMCCNSKKTDSNAQVLNSNPIEAEKTTQWESPSTPIRGCDNIINQVFATSHIQWLSSPPANQSPLKIFILWKTDSPLAKITLKKALHFHNNHADSIEIILLSEKNPTREILTNKTYQPFHFGSDNTNKSAKFTNLTTFPQVIMTTKDNVVCWQGHPSHLTSKVIEEITKVLADSNM